MTHISRALIRYASDMPFSTGMVLADEYGCTVEVRSVGGTHVALAGHQGGLTHGLVREVYPFLVQTAQMVADAEADAEEREWLEYQEELRVGALAQWAQHEDDLKEQVLARAAAEWARKNP